MTRTRIRLPSPERRRDGSLTVLAFVMLLVLFVIVLAFHYSSISTHKMFHHTYYSEKALSIIDGLTLIARGVVQEHLDVIIEKLPVGEESDLAQVIPDGGLSRKVVDVAKEVRLLDPLDSEGRPAIEPDVEVLVKMIRKEKFREPYQTVVGDDKELVGKIGITVKCGFEGFRKILNFVVSRKIVRTEYEFKKIRSRPAFFHHFSIFVKDGVPRQEREDGFADPNSNFNHLVNDRTGNEPIQGGALMVRNGPGIDPDRLPEAGGDRGSNPFAMTLPYIYLGSGGSANAAYLNLTAGGGYSYEGADRVLHASRFGEGFMLYRGRRTDFYRQLTTEFQNFLEKAPRFMGDRPRRQESGGGIFSKLKNAVKALVRGITDLFKKAFGIFDALDSLEAANPNQQSMNLPIFYVVRKDYGYAKEWGENQAYQKFGLGAGKVISNSLHLWGAQSEDMDASPTVVLGNVYRRCLSLAGYKQRRSLNDPSMRRQFEVQAGPVEYFPDMTTLFARTQDWTRPETGGGPIWTWDARVDWETGAATGQGQEGGSPPPAASSGKFKEPDGTYIPLSGPGLLGRIVPGMRRLWDDDRPLADKLFKYSVNPPESLTGGAPEGDTSTIVNNTDADANDLISQIFVLHYDQGGLTHLKDPTRVADGLRKGLLFGDLGDQNSPYFEEMLRCFLYASAGMPDAQRGKLPSGVKKVVEEAAEGWKQVIVARQNDGSLSRTVQKLDPGSISDGKKRRYWENPTQNAGPGVGVYPFSLPDPWSDQGPFKIKDNFESVFKAAVSDQDGFFRRYFKPIMTNPGRTIPYNYSLRFWLLELHNLFTLEKGERLDKVKSTIPEIRDAAFGYLGDDVNPYLKPLPSDENDPTLDDRVLARIREQRRSDAVLQNAYFFMDEYADSVQTPQDVDLEDIFRGDRYSWEEMTQEQFERRFVKTLAGPGAGSGRDVVLGTVVQVASGFTLGNVNVQGGGALICRQGSLVIDGNITAQGAHPLFLIAQDIQIAGASQIDAVLVNLGSDFRLAGSPELRVRGSLLLGGWDPSSWATQNGARKIVEYDPTVMKVDASQPTYLYNLEPKPHRYVFDAE